MCFHKQCFKLNSARSDAFEYQIRYKAKLFFLIVDIEAKEGGKIQQTLTPHTHRFSLPIPAMVEVLNLST